MTSYSQADKFENGIFWEAYKDLERQFEQFLDIVPYLDKNEDTYSFRLLNLILSIGGHVDSAFKEMARFTRFSLNPDCQKILIKIKESENNVQKGKPPVTISIKLPLKAFETEYGLSSKTIAFKRLPQREIVKPFQPSNPATNAPEWWETYNGLKHNLGSNIEKANLKNTRDALAGAFLINVIHEPAVLRLYDYNVLNFLVPSRNIRKKDGAMQVPRHILEEFLSKKQKFYGETETPLFVYSYDQ